MSPRTRFVSLGALTLGCAGDPIPPPVTTPATTAAGPVVPAQPVEWRLAERDRKSVV